MSEAGADGLAQRWEGQELVVGLLWPAGPHSKLGASPVFGKMPLKFHSLESLGQRAHVFIFPWALQIV